MEINKINSRSINQNEKKDTNKTSKENGMDLEAKRSSSLKDEVKISSEATLMGTGLKEVREADISQTEKVERLKAAIKNGSYQMDSKKVAEKMIEESLMDGFFE